MKISIIDIGSNSVRLATFADGKTLYKEIKTTRLGEGLATTGLISPAAMERTANAVIAFKQKAESEGAEKVYVFATAAVRGSVNGAEFVALVKNMGAEIDVVDGQTEAKLAYLGAVGKGDGGVIDIGGASTEFTVRDNGITVFSKSVNVGVVRLLDIAGHDKALVESAADKALGEYGNFSARDYEIFAVSGTAIALACIKQSLKVYDPKITHGTVLDIGWVKDAADRLIYMPKEEIVKLGCNDLSRAEILGGGAILLYKLMQKFEIDRVTVSESDNLEGYFLLKEG